MNKTEKSRNKKLYIIAWKTRQFAVTRILC
jgi:hypothetical protein